MEGKYSDIHDQLFRLGITPNYAGFGATACAVLLCIEQPRRLGLVTKWLYPDVAKVCGTTAAAVERNIRTVSRIAWTTHRTLLENMAYGPLKRPPQNTRFLSFLCAAVSPAFVLPVHEICETSSFSRENHDMGRMDRPTDEGCGKALFPENGFPLAKRRI